MTYQRNNRRREPGGVEPRTIAMTWGFGILVFALLSSWVGLHVGSKIAGVNPHLTPDPWAIVDGLRSGAVVWPVAATVASIGMTVVLLAVAFGIWWLLRGSRRRRTRVDDAARYMADHRDVRELQRKQAAETAKRLGVESSPGLPLGRELNSQRMLYSLWEYVIIGIAGPRVGKSTSLVVPAVLEAPGAVVTTSNKRDVLDATRDLRAEVGQVWVFDPQKVALEEPTWWWDPLSYVTDDDKAAKLAAHFASGSRAGNSSGDNNFFDSAGQDLLQGMLLAAALDHKPITQVYSWLTNSIDDDPVKILREGGYPIIADGVEGVIVTNDKTRSSIYSTAQQMASCLRSTAIAAWVTPRGAADPRPRFDPHAFVRSTDTLYSLSREGQGTAGPLVTALTAATVEAGEEYATRQPGGRLQTPMVAVLDEAANVCRWKDLPDLYSHFGSRGIPIMSLYQSWSQIVQVYGREGARKLWSASNVKMYLGGVAEPEFLRELSELIGDYDRQTSSASYNRGVRSTSVQNVRTRIIDSADLAALPRGRAVMLASGAPAVMMQTVPWMVGPHADKIRASIAAHDPANTVAVDAAVVRPASPGPTVTPAPDQRWQNGEQA